MPLDRHPHRHASVRYHGALGAAALAALFAGTSFGALLQDHTWVAGGLITTTWLLGTGYGFHLIRQASRAGGACPTPKR